MKNIFLALVLTFIGFTVQAQETKNKNAKYDIEVNGNCEQCKKRIEKAAYGVIGVKLAEWHVDDHILHLILNEEKTSLASVTKAIAKVGHDTDETKASQEDYDNLHHCCKYERK
ncbi:heavy-metal-associated domain-containing protein [Flavobacterium sp. GT3R68]|uniref:heavy-metal-associated domain-containing protein n=1 Tax=Flavobacterium sp. GT3R68 TaxID=2594437 RepID=UPI000F87A8FF|nr:metal transporter [Flavobacterium sp. GT3R68]RTY90931.1 metal transporter [Flavobacterium sp. GSN2]TRW90494.1 metal transporter [Flavobacterium sp. GT3R68]